MISMLSTVLMLVEGLVVLISLLTSVALHCPKRFWVAVVVDDHMPHEALLLCWSESLDTWVVKLYSTFFPKLIHTGISEFSTRNGIHHSFSKNSKILASSPSIFWSRKQD